MFCAECGLEIMGKRYNNGGEDLCSDCHVRQTKKAVLHHSVVSAALQNQTGAVAPNPLSTQETGTVTRNNNPFTSEDSYVQHVNALRNKIVLPKFILLGITFAISLFVLIMVSEVLVAIILLMIYAISFLVIYLKYYRYQPDFDYLVIAEGVLKRRFFRSKNDDRNFKLTQLKNHKNLNLLNVTSNNEVFLRGLAKDCVPNIDKNMLYYIDAKLQMLLAMRSAD